MLKKAEQPCLVCGVSPAGDAGTKVVDIPGVPDGKIKALFPICAKCRGKEGIESTLEAMIRTTWEHKHELAPGKNNGEVAK